jgi:hypothetical protein
VSAGALDRGREQNAVPAAIRTVGEGADPRLVLQLRGEAVNFHFGVLVIGVRSDRALNDLAYGRH